MRAGKPDALLYPPIVRSGDEVDHGPDRSPWDDDEDPDGLVLHLAGHRGVDQGQHPDHEQADQKQDHPQEKDARENGEYFG